MFLPQRVHAEEYSFSLGEIGEGAAVSGWDELISSLPEEIRDELSGFSPSINDGTAEIIREKSDVSYWMSEFTSALTDILPDMTGMLFSVLSVIFLVAVSKSSVSSVASPELLGAFSVTVRLIGVLSAFGVMNLALKVAAEYIKRLCSIMNLIVPIMQGVYISSGAISEMGVMISGVMLFITVIGNVNAYILTPLTSVLSTLTAVSYVCSEVKLGGFVSGVRRLIMRVWQVSVIFFSFMIASQNVISTYSDSLGSKTVKFALGSFIPIAGGVISEAYGTVREGLMYVKSAVGIGGIIVILLILVPGILPILFYKLALWMGSVAADMLSVSDMSGFLEGMLGVIELLFAIVLYTSLLFIFVLILFSKSGGM